MRLGFGEFLLDEERFALEGPGGPVHIERQVFELLRLLVLQRHRVVTKQELLDVVWGSRFVSESALTSRIKSARRAVGDDGKRQCVIKTVHTVGYQFVADVQTDIVEQVPALPRLRSTPIGRAQDIDAVVGRVRAAPLVTVTGPGGIGKTTVAVAAANRLRADHSGEVIFVDLSPVPARTDITRAVADAAGIEGAASESLERVADHLAGRQVLLVLDNCEHVVQHAARMADRMLERGDAAHILATSREALEVAGEHVWPLGPLSTHGPDLFVERANAAEPRGLWRSDDPAVSDLCQRLDNIPLALELAAGQLRRFEIDELRKALDDRLVLQWRQSAAAQRHASMETAIDWSYQLLDGPEQYLLRQLSVFPSAFDMYAVAALMAQPRGGSPVVVFGQLVDKNLVVRIPGSGRYRILETIRAFLRDRLDSAGESAAAFERHRRHVVERIVAASRLDRWMSARLGATLRSDIEDARQAFRLSLSVSTTDAVDIAIGMSFLWRNAIGGAEGEQWISRLRELNPSGADRRWLDILRADVGQGRGDYRQMFDAAGSASASPEPALDPAGASLIAQYAGLAHLTDTEYSPKELENALELGRLAGDDRLLTLFCAFMTVPALAAGRRDEVKDAVPRLDEAASEDGYDRYIVHWVGWMLGLAERDSAVARHWMVRQQEFLVRTGIVETWISSFSTAMCDAIDGVDVHTELSRTLALADREGFAAEADCVLVLGYEQLCAGQFERAAELIGTALHGRFNATAHYVLYRAVLENSLRWELDDAVLAAAVDRGRHRTVQAALAEYGVTRSRIGRIETG
ncbi:MAG: winged helix-turn-helix domain-containing protein [Nakamurella sp.]